jgi:RNA polymerase sigma-70 factor (ECF subfamily)
MTMGSETKPELERFREYLYLLARLRLDSRLRGKLEPSDLVQQTFLKAHQASERWQELDDEARMAWLRQILANTVADEVRRYGRNKRDTTLERSHLATRDKSSVRIDALPAVNQTSPSQQVIRKEDLSALREALRALPEEQRRAIELHHIDGGSLVEVATRMRRSHASVAGLIRRGLRSLRQRLKPL